MDETKEATLRSAIKNLTTLSHELHNIIFNVEPSVEGKQTVSQNSLLELRNDVLEANTRLKEVFEALKVIKE